MADFKDLIDQQKITNEKQDKVIALLQEGDSPQALKRASADEVKAEYDTLKLGQVFEIAYSKISGMADIDNIIQDQAKQDAVAYQAMVESVSGQTDVLKKIAGILITGLGIDKKALLADQRERDEQEREKILSNQTGDGGLDGKKLGGDGLSKTFKSLKGLIGGVVLGLGGILVFVKALQDKVLQGAVKDLFEAMGKVFSLLGDLAVALMPVVTTILTYTVEALTAGFKATEKAFKLIKDFGENAKINEEDYKGVITGPGAFLLPDFLRRIRDAVKGVTPAVSTVEDIEDTTTGIKGAFFRISSYIKQILAPLGRVADVIKDVVTPLAKLPVITTVTNFFSKGGAKAGGFFKFLGKLFLPFTIIIGLVDTVKGFYEGFFGKDLEEGEEPPQGFIEKMMAGLEGGITGLVNSLVGAPLDFLKGAVGWVLGKMGFTGTEEALASFRFSDVFSDILSIIFNPIDSMVALFRKIMSFDIMGWLTENVPGFGAIVDFFTEDDFDRVKREIRENRNTENQIARQQQYIDSLVEDLESGRLNENQAELARQEIERRLGVIRLARLESGLTEEGITQRIAELEEMAAAAEGGDKKKLQKRIEELEQEQLELAQSKNIVVITNDNKQTQFNSTKGTYSVGKSTTNNDFTMNLLQYGNP